jgi:hypothetical protein
MNANHEAWKAREAKLAAALRKICEAPNGIAVINAIAEARPVLKDVDAQALDDATQAFAARGKP